MASKNLCPTAKSPGVQGREKLIGKRFLGGFCLTEWIINWNTGSPWHFKMNYTSLKRQSRKWKEASDPPLLTGTMQTEVTQVQSQFSFRRMTSKGTTRSQRKRPEPRRTAPRAGLTSDQRSGDTLLNRFQNCYRPQTGVCCLFPPFWMEIAPVALVHLSIVSRRVCGKQTVYLLSSLVHTDRDGPHPHLQLVWMTRSWTSRLSLIISWNTVWFGEGP